MLPQQVPSGGTKVSTKWRNHFLQSGYAFHPQNGTNFFKSGYACVTTFNVSSLKKGTHFGYAKIGFLVTRVCPLFGTSRNHFEKVDHHFYEKCSPWRWNRIPHPLRAWPGHIAPRWCNRNSTVGRSGYALCQHHKQAPSAFLIWSTDINKNAAPHL